MFCIATEELQNFLHAELPSAALATFDSLVGKFTLFLLEFENPLFYRIFDGDLVDNNINLLRQAMNSIYSLLLNELLFD